MSIACHFFVVFVKQLGGGSTTGTCGLRLLGEVARVTDRPYAGLVAAVVADACGGLAALIGWL